MGRGAVSDTKGNPWNAAAGHLAYHRRAGEARADPADVGAPVQRSARVPVAEDGSYRQVPRRAAGDLPHTGAPWPRPVPVQPVRGDASDLPAGRDPAISL